ncbi:mechanosensitive ion channel protein (plasmid) [Ensifer adhaerens]|uniref:Mechanosensitive ion channel family protein n=2 Tax=Ensifer adhaerens TaxID=106592 RepID=A0ABY8HSY7_ENSAD|nr:mechanosensitive ion channel family protein [Ensifer adhaerens]ANK76814.1 mechanosensitive ion channel protein [Ensifer adhaerens]KDP75390.1 mechanosensitive ion channel protein [Ensifer adhaerens]WFP95241.1 mechanosensitive ion channel family protein [Ensifer adhaerens]
MQTLSMNRMCTFIRLALAGLAFVAALAVLSSPGSAQEKAPDPVQAEKVQRFLELVDDPHVRSWLLSAKPATGAAAPAAVATVSYAGFASIFRARAAQLLGGLRAFPAETARAASVLQSELDTSRSARPIVFVLAFIAAGLAAQWCFWWLSRGWRAWIASLRFLTVRDKLVAISARLLWGTSYVLAFALGSLGFFLAFDWSPLVREIVVGYLFAVVIFRLALVAFDFLLAPSGSDGFANAERFRVIPVSDQAAAHWTKRLGYLVGWYAFGSVTVHLLTTLGFADPSRQVVAYTLGIVLLLLGIEAVWNRPMVHRPTEHASRFSRIGVRARNWVWTGYFVALWLLWVAGAMKPFWIAVVAAALPGAIALTRASVDNLLTSSLADAESPTRPGVISVMVERGIRAALLVGAIVVLAEVLDIELTGIAAQDSAALRLMRGALSAGIILLAIDLVWNIVKVLIDRKLGETETAHETGSERERKRARIRTLLPILKNVLMILFVAVAIMMALSSLGVEIAPLIAGAGVVGVAIGFGAQTVVKDVISGMFYLLDDAFRVGEYIQSGSYKGTVESFSLRSVKLRHHRGAIYIVPFSELGAVQNMSRDWVVEKLTVTVGYDTDVDKARKIIKKIGQELLVDPEFAAITIQPLKMQGIDSLGDSGLILRMKFTTVPGEQFMLKRRALMMINKAFHDNDIKPAFPTVQVAGDRSSDVAAAAQQALAKHNEAVVAAAASE